MPLLWSGLAPLPFARRLLPPLAARLPMTLPESRLIGAHTEPESFSCALIMARRSTPRERLCRTGCSVAGPTVPAGGVVGRRKRLDVGRPRRPEGGAKIISVRETLSQLPIMDNRFALPPGEWFIGGLCRGPRRSLDGNAFEFQRLILAEGTLIKSSIL